MRVGHLVSGYLRVTENWIHALMTANPSVEPFVLNRGARINEDLFPVPAGTTCQTWVPTRVAAKPTRGRAWGYSRFFFDAFHRAGGDLLHAHFGVEGVLAVPLASALGVPLVTSFYGYDATMLPRDPSWRQALKLLFARGTLFFAEGPALANTLRDLGCPADCVLTDAPPVRIPQRPASRRGGGGLSCSSAAGWSKRRASTPASESWLAYAA